MKSLNKSAIQMNKGCKALPNTENRTLNIEKQKNMFHNFNLNTSHNNTCNKHNHNRCALTKSKSQYFPKDHMKDILSDGKLKLDSNPSNYEINNTDKFGNLKRGKPKDVKKDGIRRSKSTMFIPKYNDINTNNIKNKVEDRHFLAIGRMPSKANLKSLKDDEQIHFKDTTMKDQKCFFDDLNHKERKIKQNYPSMTIEEVKAMGAKIEHISDSFVTKNSLNIEKTEGDENNKNKSNKNSNLNKHSKMPSQASKKTVKTNASTNYNYKNDNSTISSCSSLYSYNNTSKKMRVQELGSNIFNSAVKQSTNVNHLKKMELLKNTKENSKIGKNTNTKPAVVPVSKNYDTKVDDSNKSIPFNKLSQNKSKIKNYNDISDNVSRVTIPNKNIPCTGITTLYNKSKTLNTTTNNKSFIDMSSKKNSTFKGLFKNKDVKNEDIKSTKYNTKPLNTEKTHQRAKSAWDRKQDQFKSTIKLGDFTGTTTLMTNICKIKTSDKKSLLQTTNFDNEKENIKELVRNKTAFKSSKINAINHSTSVLQGGKFIEKALQRSSMNNDVERIYKINGITNLTTDKDIKMELALKGIHASKIKMPYDLLKDNVSIKKLELTLRTNKKDNNIPMLKDFFNTKYIEETFIDEKPFLKKPKTADLCPLKMDIFDTKLSDKIGKRDLVTTKHNHIKVRNIEPIK